jgi:SAM-dependent methyltransferase
MANERSPGYGACRFCGTALTHPFVDLGMHPPCQSQVSPARLTEPEVFFPLKAFVCDRCLLVQLPEYVKPESIFTEYAYFSSYSDTWLAHARAYTESMITRFGIGPGSRVIELASNDGYLLQYFAQRGVPVLGVEPAANVAEAARRKGIPTVVTFFGEKTARQIVGEHGHADLLLGNNVLAHVPDLLDFVRGMKVLLAPDGVFTMEFPHLMRLIEGNQLDTIYHEHYSYFSFGTVEKVFASQGLTLFDVDRLPTHGGSLRIYGRHTESSAPAIAPAVADLERDESARGMRELPYYLAFEERVRETKRNILELLVQAKREGRQVAGYSASGKFNTLLNYCGIGTDMVDYVVDRNPYKQGHYCPGSRIPIHPVEQLYETKPDFLLIGVWNLTPEVMQQTAGLRAWGGRWIVPIPEVRILP